MLHRAAFTNEELCFIFQESSVGDVQDLGHIEISEGKEEEHSEGGEDDGEESVCKHRW